MIPKIYLHISVVMIESFFSTGLSLMASCFGFSAAKARAARVSIIILSQRSCTTLKTVAPLKIAPTKTMKRVLKLKVI